MCLQLKIYLGLFQRGNQIFEDRIQPFHIHILNFCDLPSLPYDEFAGRQERVKQGVGGDVELGQLVAIDEGELVG